MNKETADILNALTRDFYATYSSSFHETRTYGWPGWSYVLDLLFTAALNRSESQPYRILDIGCGNLRFERSLIQDARFGALCGESEDICVFEAFCLDAEESLVAEGMKSIDQQGGCLTVRFDKVDIYRCLQDDMLLNTLSGLPSMDMIVCFALMHHISGYALRERLLEDMLSRLEPGGVAAVSFWQLHKSQKIMENAASITAERAPELGVADQLEEGDLLLGWQGSADVVRYCHDFSDTEISALVDKVLEKMPEVHVLKEYSADGRKDDMNRYVVFERVGI